MKSIRYLIAIVTILASIVGILILILALAGLRPFILMSESMEPSYAKGSLCWVDTRAGLDSVNVGDVLVYRSPANTLVLHRLVNTSPSAEPSTINVTMQGDANDMSQDITLSGINYVGREVCTIPRLGTLVDHMLSGNVIWPLVALFVVLSCIPWESIRRRTTTARTPRTDVAQGTMPDHPSMN